MDETQWIKISLWNHSKYPRVAAVMGDPEEHVRAILAPLPSGTRVCVLVRRHGADAPFSYRFDWLHERPDLEIRFDGHLNAHMWQIAAEAERAARSSEW